MIFLLITGENPFKCDRWDYAGLYTHLLIAHTGEKPSQWNLCDFSTAQRRETLYVSPLGLYVCPKSYGIHRQSEIIEGNYKIYRCKVYFQERHSHLQRIYEEQV